MRRGIGGMILAAAVLASGCRRAPPSPPSQRGSGSAQLGRSPPPTAPVGDPVALYARAKEELAAGRDRQAELLLTEVARSTSDPGLQANAWLARGSLAEDRGDRSAAVTAYERVVSLRPEDPEAWRVLALALEPAGGGDEPQRLTRRAAALHRLVTLDQEDLHSLVELAGLEAALGHPDLAKTLYLSYETRRTQATRQLGRSRDPLERARAATVLGGARDASTARALVLALTDRDARVRVACAEALARVGVDLDPELRPALRAQLEQERDARVRAAVEATLR